MSRFAFLDETTWLDDDGYHVWTAHDCEGGRVETMLPWPTWQVRSNGQVWPSINCSACDAHYIATIRGGEQA